MYDLLDDPGRRALIAASKAAAVLGHPQIGAGHLLAGILQGDSAPARVLSSFGLTAAKVAAHLANLSSTERPTAPAGSPRLGEPLRTALADAHGAARANGAQLTAATLVHAALSCEDPDVTVLLNAAGTTRAAVLAELGHGAANVPAANASDLLHAAPDEGGSLPTELSKFGYDLVARARQGRLAPVYGRDAEVARTQTILARREKNNPVLIGEPGVGKTAIVEALAHLIATGQCVDALRDRPLIVLDIAAMVAGAKSRGDFEERLKRATAAAGKLNAVLFIDEIHQIVGAGASGGSMDTANLLKEKLARGQLTLIGATTLDEYRKHIEADAALARRLARVLVEPPTVEATVAILKTVRQTFAGHHRVRYTDEALTAAAQLSDMHVHDRNLPDKAIDALDEAGAVASIAIMRAPDEARATYIERAQVRDAIAKAVSTENYELAGTLSAQERRMTAQIVAHGPDLGVVDVPSIAAVVALMAGVPVGAVATDEQDSLRTLEARVSSRVIGQRHAVTAVCAAVRRRRVLGSDRPASFVFAGPTGVGKTELATALSDELFGGSDSGKLLKFDMSEYAEKHTVSRLIGSPPGYAGYEDGGQLTEAVRRNPRAVVLFDEVEKAHPDVFDLLLQILEDGRLTDSSGRVVRFDDTIIVLTTNLGSTAAARTAVGFSSGVTSDIVAAARQHVLDAVKGHFRPELLNRFDDIVVFDRLTRTDLTTIVWTLLARPLAQLSTMGVRVTLTDAAVEELLVRGFDPAMGARPLRRAITRMLENPLSDALLTGSLPRGSHALVDAVPGRDELVVVPEPHVPEPALVTTSAAGA